MGAQAGSGRPGEGGLAMHECVYDATTETASEHTQDGLLYRTITQHPSCSCGKLQPSRGGRGRAPHRRELSTTTPTVPLHPANQRVAQALVDYGASPVPWAGRESQLTLEPGVADARLALLDLTRAGLVWIEERNPPGWQPYRVHIADAALAEVARPGYAARRKQVLEEARKLLQEPTTQTAAALAALDGVARAWPEEAIRVLAIVAARLPAKPIPINQASAQWLGDSKVLRRHVDRIETVLGPLEEQGLLHNEHLVLLGGRGIAYLGSQQLSITTWGPIVALTRSRALQLSRLEAPDIVFTENRAVFDAASLSQLHGLNQSLIVFTGGTPGPAVRHMAGIATDQIRVWCDMDAEGIRFYRLIHAASNGRATPLKMSVADFDQAQVRKPLDKANKRAALARELAAGGPLQDVLERIQATQTWVEQEVQL